MVEKTIKIMNKAGIHCRPASVILLAAREFSEHKFIVKSRKGDSDLTSMLSLIALGLEKGDEVRIRVEGQDEVSACEKMSSLFEKEFDFPQN